MNKRAGVSTGLKFIIGLIIGIMVLIVLLNVVDKVLPKSKEDQSINYFNALNREIETMAMNSPTTQLISLNKKQILISFNNQNRNVEIESPTGKKENFEVKKPADCVDCLCICKTENSKYLELNDCIGIEDICYNHNKKIDDFYLFEQGLKELTIEKTPSSITIT